MVTLSNTQIGEAIHKLLNTSGPEEIRRLLRDYPWLTSPEVDEKLTRVIANKRREKQLPSVAVYVAARGFLRRCQLTDIETALKTQPSWPLDTQGPLTQLLAFDETAPFDLRIKQAKIALRDVEPETEPDVYALILGLGYKTEADASLNEMLFPEIERFKAAALAWTVADSVTDKIFMGWLQQNLGYFYMHRIAGNRNQNVEEALGWFEKAEKLAKRDSAEFLDTLILQGNAYLDRIEDERRKNIEQAIYFYREAYRLAARTDQLNRLGEIEHNLAVAYRVRLAGRRIQSFERAKKWAERALQCFDRRKNPQEWARVIAELATIYAHRHLGNRADNLEQAIKYAKQALEIYRADPRSRQWALLQLNLGNLYCDRVKGVPEDNYRKAITHFEAVINQHDPTSNPLGWAEAINNLGTAYAGLSTSPFDPNYHRAVTCFQQALQVNKPETLPAETRRTAANWGNLAFRFGQWNEAADALKIALKAGEILYQVSSSEAGRRVELAESAGLAAKASFCLLKLDPIAPTEALLQLEQSKTRLLSEVLAMGTVDLDKLPAHQQPTAQKLRKAWEEVHKLRGEMRLRVDTPARRNDLDLAKQLGQKYAEVNQLIMSIRKDNPNFMPTGLDLTELLALIPPEGALVAPLVTAQGSAVFVLPHGAKTVEVQHVILPEAMAFTEADLNALLIGSESKPGWLRAYAIWQNGGSFEDWEAAIETFTGQLWDRLMSPINCRLAALGLAESAPIILMPQGGLGLLPLHAAWREVNGVKRAFLDDYTVTYVPSGYALSVSQRRSQEALRQTRSLLAVVNPTGDLPFTPIEGEVIVSLFDPDKGRTLIEDRAKLEEVIKEVPGRAYLHFSCHGTYNWQDILRSGLYLAGDNRKPSLTLAKIISGLDLSATRLVTLSACETGLTEFEQTPDEYIGLPAGFLQAGAPGVVSTLWAVDDLSTSLLIGRFYQYHIQDRLSSARALRQAQKWLRDKITWGEMAAYLPYLEKTVTSLKQQEVEVRGTDQSLYIQLKTKRQTLENELKIIREGLERHGSNSHVSRFNKPYYWAAFTMIGVGTNEH